jgi:hypothetical protein
MRGEKAGKGCITLFLGIFVAAGIFFGILIVRSLLNDYKTYKWAGVPGKILASEAIVGEKEESDRYSVRIEYQYEWEGGTLRSNRLGLNSPKFGSTNQAENIAHKYPPGSEVTVYVDPAQPENSILEKPDAWQFLLLLLPLGFIAVPGFILWAVWTKRSPEGGPVSEKAKTRSGRWFFLIFLLAGLGFGIPFIFIPIYKIIDARGWNAVDATVQSSRVQSHHSSDGTTYSVDILYEYEVSGVKYRSSRYDFMSGSSSGYKGKAEIVRRYPEGKTVTCYVNPGNPTEAVLNRDFGWWILFGLIPGVFILVGFFGFIGSKPKSPAPLRAAEEIAGSHELKPTAPPWAKFAGMCVVMLVWNGVVSLFLYKAVEGAKTEWFILIFMIPFALVGLLLVAGTLHAFLGLFNPRVTLVIEPGTPRLGERLTIRWRTQGRASALSRLKIELAGREEATYRRGTRSTTDREVFHTLPVADVNDLVSVREGERSFELPQDLMHSFEAPNNKIVWVFKVHGEIARWPDVDDEYKVQIRPARKWNEVQV